MNTLTISKRLIQAGSDPQLAEEQTQILLDITEDLASKKDVQELKEDMRDFKAFMRKDMGDFKVFMRKDMGDFKASVKEEMQELKKSTKDDIKQLRGETRWLFGLFFIALGVLMTLLKIF